MMKTEKKTLVKVILIESFLITDSSTVKAPKFAHSDLGPHCLPKRLLKHYSRREKQTIFVVIGALRMKIKYMCAYPT